MDRADTKNQYILIVDDTIDNLHLLSDVLRDQGYGVRCAKNGAMALKALAGIHPDLILLDIQMPGMDGYDVCRKLKQEPKTKDIPVIFLSASDSIQNKVRAFEVGGIDYVTKPFQLEEVLIRISNQIAFQSANQEIRQLNRKLQEQIVQQSQKTQELKRINQQLQQEISTRDKVEAQLLRDVLHDSLNGLPDRTLIMTKIDLALQKMRSHS